MKCLVIVDMQYDFQASRKQETINNVIREVCRAKEKNVPIIILEYSDHGHTHNSIVNTLGNYNKWIVVTKSTDDGSNEVLEGLNNLGIPADYISRVVLTGVNFSYCVFSTAKGLTQVIPTSIVIKKSACNCTESSDWRGWVNEQLHEMGVRVTK